MDSFKAHAALLSANIVYGVNYSFAKDVMPQFITPFGFIFFRVICALSLFWASSIFIKERIQSKDLKRLFFCGVFGVAINQLCFFKGLSITSPINAAIIMTSTPIIVLVISAFFLHERISKSRIIGIFFGLVGACVLLLIGKKGVRFNSASFWGDVFILINATSYGTYLIVVKPLLKKYKPVTVMKWVFLFGLLLVTPFSISEAAITDFEFFSSDIWLKFFFVIIGTTFLAYLLNIYALKRLHASVVSFYIYLQPLLATLFAIYLGKDHLDNIKIIACLLLFSGVYMISKPSLSTK